MKQNIKLLYGFSFSDQFMTAEPVEPWRQVRASA
jgi:hypothetical protein